MARRVSMEDVDPDEELARRLHREMNGLNRVRRRAPPALPPGQLRMKSLPEGAARREAVADTCLSTVFIPLHEKTLHVVVRGETLQTDVAVQVVD